MRFFIFACAVSAVSAIPMVETPLGKITGRVRRFKPKNAEVFLGIPYAKPPLGNLRFELPKPYGRVDGLRAIRFKSACTQPAQSWIQNIKSWLSTEDCLYLNVFRPAGTLPDDRKAVAVLIHGGAFTTGSASDDEYNLGPFAVLGDVIAVNLNYRLGVFGFANMGSLAPANVALFDQRLALEWVNDNIKAFGGDPNRITLIGVSAGSAAVHAHIATPLNKNRTLFSAALMDASALQFGLREETENSLPRIKTLAAELRCPSDGQEMLKCLKGVSGVRLNRAQYKPDKNPLFTFQPTIDGVFLPKHIDEIDISEFANVKLMIGTSKDEGTIFAKNLIGQSGFPEPDTEDDFIEFCIKLADVVKFPTNCSDPTVRQKVIAEYYKRNETMFESVSRFITDSAIFCPTKHFVQKYAKQNRNVYAYQFERHFKASYLGLDMNVLGAFHGSAFINFMGPFLDTKFWFIVPSDKQFAGNSVEMVSSFVKTNHVPSLRGVQWPDFSENGEVFRINDNVTIADGFPRRGNCLEIFGLD